VFKEHPFAVDVPRRLQTAEAWKSVKLPDADVVGCRILKKR